MTCCSPRSVLRVMIRGHSQHQTVISLGEPAVRELNLTPQRGQCSRLHCWHRAEWETIGHQSNIETLEMVASPLAWWQRALGSSHSKLSFFVSGSWVAASEPSHLSSIARQSL